MSIRRVVVVGASLAGLGAARVLAEHVDEVVLIERDALPDEPVARRGVPQARHLHNLLLRGVNELEALFPGFGADLYAAGAVPVDMLLELKMLSIFGWFPRHPSEIVMPCCSRPLIEQVVRRRVRALPRITWLEGHDVEGLILNSEQVCGVRCRRREVRAGDALEIESLLVVDAGGRGSRLPGWLDGAGLAKPAVTEVNPFLGYATRIFCMPHSAPDWSALVVRNPMPSSRGGAIMPREGGLWVATLFGFGRDYPPTDEAGFDAFARSLADPGLHEALSAAEPVSDIAGYRQTTGRWRHFEHLSSWPAGYVALGDAVCTFNPLYGQGMTVAMMGVAALRALLTEQGVEPDLGGKLRQRVARLLAAPWRIATGEDYRYPGTEGPPRPCAARAAHWYGDRVVRAALRNPDVHTRWMRVVHMLDDPATLLAAGILGPALSSLH